MREKKKPKPSTMPYPAASGRIGVSPKKLRKGHHEKGKKYVSFTIPGSYHQNIISVYRLSSSHYRV